MPKMTDQQTGETKEISMEEFMEIVRQSGGKGSLQQIVTDANGNKTVTDDGNRNSRTAEFQQFEDFSVTYISCK